MPHYRDGLRAECAQIGRSHAGAGPGIFQGDITARMTDVAVVHRNSTESQPRSSAFGQRYRAVYAAPAMAGDFGVAHLLGFVKF